VGKKFFQACRFNFPRPVNAEMRVNEVAKCVEARARGRRVQLVYLPRTTDERFVNNYNPAIAYMWQVGQ
jgi:hypothetical protein